MLPSVDVDLSRAVAVKQNAVRAQVADQRAQIIRQFWIGEKRREQSLSLGGSFERFARIADRDLQIVRRFLGRAHRGIGFLDDAVEFFRRLGQGARRLIQVIHARFQILHVRRRQRFVI